MEGALVLRKVDTEEGRLQNQEVQEVSACRQTQAGEQHLDEYIARRSSMNNAPELRGLFPAALEEATAR